MSNGPTLTILAGPTVPAPLPPRIVELLDSATVSTRGGREDGFELRFRMSGRNRLTDLLLAGAQSPRVPRDSDRDLPRNADHHRRRRDGPSPDRQPGGAADARPAGRGLAELMDREDRTGQVQYMGLPPRPACR